MPPRIALEPFRIALELTNNCSAPSASFHETTVAPNKWTDTDSPVGSFASTVFSLMEIVGWGIDAPTPIEVGFLPRSIVEPRADVSYRRAVGGGEEEERVECKRYLVSLR
jgi:hypothetical protein